MTTEKHECAKCRRLATQKLWGYWYCGKHGPTLHEDFLEEIQDQAAEDARKLAVFDELLEAAEGLLACRWIKETISGSVMALEEAVTKAKGKRL